MTAPRVTRPSLSRIRTRECFYLLSVRSGSDGQVEAVRVSTLGAKTSMRLAATGICPWDLATRMTASFQSAST